FKDKSSAILENPNSLDRVYLAKQIQTVSNQELEYIFMNDKKFDPRNTILLSKDLKVSKVSGTGNTSILSYSPNTIKVKTNTVSEEVLVLADQYEEGWKAQIDNKETPISPANLIFRAIKIPAGSHEVVFSYWPKSFDTGLKISLASLLLIVLISLLTVKTKQF
ncbi:MAG: YfhO family protein, partial [Candidatus Daviesbacteria bacterium]|nr:YfhO family protein [Candidatus Daviesbacteria bacterium]